MVTRTFLIPQGPSLAPTADLQIDAFGDGIANSEFCTAPQLTPEEMPVDATTQSDVPLFHHTATVSMADELCRLAREFKRRVSARELLPALTALSALGPLHEILIQQFVTRLMTESVTAPKTPPTVDAPPMVEIHGISPSGYL